MYFILSITSQGIGSKNSSLILFPARQALLLLMDPGTLHVQIRHLPRKWPGGGIGPQSYGNEHRKVHLVQIALVSWEIDSGAIRPRER